MTPLMIDGTERAPQIAFDFEKNTFRIAGESYPEDVTKFFGPLIEALETHLDANGSKPVRFEFELIYFNSSSAKAIMTIMEILDATAKAGAEVEVYWFYDAEDDTMEELGEEFGEDLEHATFHLKEMES